MLAWSMFVTPDGARAVGNDSVVLRGSAGLIYNSNVFNLADDVSEAGAESILGTRQKSSWIQEYGAGLRIDLPLSRQKLALDALVTRTVYDEFPEIDYTGYTAQGTWAWKVGSDWFGQIGGHADKSRQANASGQEISPPLLVENYDALFDAHYLLTPRWEIIGSVGGRRVRYDAAQFRTGDSNVTAQSIGGLYRTPAGNGTGVRLTLEQGEWPNDASGVDNSYDQYTVAAVLEWGLTGRSRLSGDIGYTSHTRTEAERGDASGPSGRLTYRHSFSGKSEAQATVYQLFGPLDDVSASYVRTRGMDLGATYLATAKISLLPYATWKTLEYLGGAMGSLQPGREDEYVVLGLTGRYAATRALAILLGAEHEQRDSNLASGPYEVYELYLRAQVEF